MTYTADDIVDIHKAGRVASLIGIDGGTRLTISLPMLRQIYALGACYMTLTHTLNDGLGRFGDRRSVATQESVISTGRLHCTEKFVTPGQMHSRL
jgi:microsomal dipeptidase-like Zn-dependent dipeptidase